MGSVEEVPEVVLWRATDGRRYTGRWSCWATSRKDAEAYRDNPGFGGPILLRATVDADDNTVLDLAGYRYPRLAMEALYDALYPYASDDERADALEEWGVRAYEYQCWEDDPSVARDLERSGYRWIVYQDDYPAGAVTWVYLGSTPLSAQEV